MLTKSKNLIALGVLSAALLATANPSLAGQVHHRAHAAYGVHTPSHPARGAYALDPAYQVGSPNEDGYDAPRATSRPSVTWDPYALRWDGGN